jgi:hypothetical protein
VRDRGAGENEDHDRDDSHILSVGQLAGSDRGNFLATSARVRCGCLGYVAGTSVIAAISQRVPTRSGGPQYPVP